MFKKCFPIIVLLFSFNYISVVFSQDDPDSLKNKSEMLLSEDSLKVIEVTIERTKPIDQEDSIQTKGLKIIAYPYAFYTPETNLAFGVGSLLYFRLSPSPNVNLSKIQAAGYYTINNQYFFNVKPSIYFSGKAGLYLEADFNFGEEFRYFYGIGNNTPEIEDAEYKMNYWGLTAELAAEDLIVGSSKQGLIYEYSNSSIIDKLNNPNLIDSEINGIEGGQVGGLGLSLTFDNRDNIFYTSCGYFLKLTGTFYRLPFGSDYSYDKYMIDYRKFWTIYDSHVLALQVYSNFTLGEPPFYKLPQVGGSYRMRGFIEGRYMDKQYFLTQFEYRKIVYWRIGIALSYSYGNVFDKFENLRLKDFKHTWGAGLRFVFDKEEKINIRVDLGFAEGTTGVYFALDEAF